MKKIRRNFFFFGENNLTTDNLTTKRCTLPGQPDCEALIGAFSAVQPFLTAFSYFANVCIAMFVLLTPNTEYRIQWL